MLNQLTASVLLCLLFSVTPVLADEPLNFMQRDLNGNGRLSLEESGFEESFFKRLDESQNGELSLGEFDDFWLESAERAAFSDLAYGALERQKLDLYLPQDITGTVPLVLWIHGGSWDSGSKDVCPIRNLTESGFAVASVNYRLVQDAHFPSQLDDCLAALTWLRNQQGDLGIQFGSASAVGLSAGAHLALLMGCRGDVERVVSFAAPVDLTQPKARELREKTLEALVGSPLAEHMDLLQLASPKLQVTRTSADSLLFHGTKDRTIPYQESVSMAGAVGEANGSVELRLVADGSHTLVGGPEGWDRLVRFLQGL